MKKSILFLSLILAGSLSLSACSGASSSSSKAVTYETYAARDEANAYSENMAVGEAEALSSGGAVNKEGVPDTENINIENEAGKRKLITTINLSLQTLEFDKFLEDIKTEVNKHSGYIESSEINPNNYYSPYYSPEVNLKTANIRVRIPEKELNDFLKFTEGSANVISRYENVQDITLNYVDVESRKKSLEIERDSLWALLEKAESVDAIITIQARLSEVRADLENYESQLKLFDNQVSYATVSLSIDEVKKYEEEAPQTVGQRIVSGFKRNISGIGDFFVNLTVAILANSPTLILLAILIAVIVLVIKAFIKKSALRAKKIKESKEEKKQEQKTENTDKAD